MGGGCTKEKHFSTHPHSPSWIPAYLASVTKVSSGSRYILAGGPRFRWRALILSAKGKWTFLPFIHHDGDGISHLPSAILYMCAHYSPLSSFPPSQSTRLYLALSLGPSIGRELVPFACPSLPIALHFRLPAVTVDAPILNPVHPR